MTFPRLIASALLLLSAASSHALDFRTVGAAPAILYDAPSHKGGKLFIAPRGMPVEVVLTYGDWVKVRDVAGDLAWIEARSLGGKRNLIVRNGGARVRAGADDAAQALFIAEKGLLLELAEAQPNTWAKVRHRDGTIGFIRTTDVWGL